MYPVTPGNAELSNTTVLNTDLPLPLIGRGKVRDIYQAGRDLLIVATDRISAFDCILPTGIPGKGEVLNRLSIFWFDYLKNVIPNHLITANVDNYPAVLRTHAVQLRGRSMLVKRAAMLEVECVARGYLSGSGWKEYRDTGMVCGIPLPPGLRESDRLPEPIFTPATKAESGHHDENISFDRLAALVTGGIAERLRSATLEIYKTAAEYAERKGIIIADTKFEFGFVDGALVLADEVLTPDSSRFWPRAEYAPGGPQPSYDKQFVRDYLESIHWNKQPPAPVLPHDVVESTSAKYREAYRLLAGAEI
jgi:phosphoribosylaminoimidazole-succinocarboxamide synthase